MTAVVDTVGRMGGGCPDLLLVEQLYLLQPLKVKIPLNQFLPLKAGES